jgi:hypothetical protein
MIMIPPATVLPTVAINTPIAVYPRDVLAGSTDDPAARAKKCYDPPAAIIERCHDVPPSRVANLERDMGID